MSESSGQEKTESATPKRRADAKKKGQVAKSRDLPGAVGMLAAGVFFWMAGADMIEGAMEIMRGGFSNVVRADLSSAQFHEIFTQAAASGIKLLTPLMLIMVAVGVAANVAQTGPVASFNPIQPKWSKISPVEGFKRIFSTVTLVELVKSIFKIALIGITVQVTLSKEIDRLPTLASTSIETFLPYLGQVSLKIVLITGFLMLVLGVLDFVFQYFENEKKMRMTKEEVKREMKETDGDPMVRTRIRALQRESASKRMMGDVPDADVVVTNPTHLAIAIKYSGDSMAAPKVVAKGAGHIAKKIREIAKENGVPILEDKPLARALFKSVEVGQEVPMDLYQAVAEILAFVYRLNDKKRMVRA